MKTAIPFLACLALVLVLAIKASNDRARILRLERQVDYLEARKLKAR